MEFRILGPLEVRDGERVLPLGGATRRAVLARLLLDANRAVQFDALVTGVWGEEPPAAVRASLRNHAARLRRELGDRLVTHGDGYLLRVGPDELDLERFARLVAEARYADPARRASLLHDALALWRGPALADLAGEQVHAHAAHLDERRLSAVEERIDADLELGRHGELVAELESLVAEHPFRERLRGQLVLALYRSGRQADALDAYAATRRTLVDELGTEPGPELQELQRAILRHDPELSPPVSDVAATPVQPSDFAESRRVVTVLVADLSSEPDVGDPEARREALQRRAESADGIVTRHGGESVWLGGERLLAVFGVPRAHEGDPLRAVRAARELGDKTTTRRAALATGEVVTGDTSRGHPLVSGLPVDEADRLLAEAGEDEIRIADRTWRLVRHAASGRLRDGVWVLDSIDTESPPLLRRLETPLVGREDELAEILGVFRRGLRERRPQLVTVFGAPGIGKTRLAAECSAELAPELTAVMGRCAEYGEDATYAPLREALAPLVGPDGRAWLERTLSGEPEGEAVATQVSSVLHEGSVVPVAEAAWAMRRLLEALARQKPLLLVLDDVQWAAPALLDLVESVVELVAAPVLVLCLSRPELLDVRPFWGGGRLSSSSLLLDALSDRESEQLLTRLVESEVMDEAVRERILAVADGNPLFLEQLLASALEDETEAIPDSIHGLLAARLDHLEADERALAQAAAVVGLSISTRLLGKLVGSDVTEQLRTLVRRELVRHSGVDSAGDETWEFRHALIRDEAYRSIPKRRRAELHEAVARYAVEAGMSDIDVTAGYHLEQAVRSRREIGETGTALDDLAREAARHLGAAGLAAYQRDDAGACASLLGRASELLPAAAPERLALMPKLALLLLSSGDRAGSKLVVSEARTIAEQLGDEVASARIALVEYDTAVRAEPAPHRVLDGPRADRARSRACRGLRGSGLGRAPALPHLRSHRRARAEAARARRCRCTSGRISLRLAWAMAWTCIALPHSSVPVAEAIVRVREILDDPPNRGALAPALGALGQLEAMRGGFDDARELVRRGPGDPARAGHTPCSGGALDLHRRGRDHRRRPRRSRGDSPAGLRRHLGARRSPIRSERRLATGSRALPTGTGRRSGAVRPRRGRMDSRRLGGGLVAGDPGGDRSPAGQRGRARRLFDEALDLMWRWGESGMHADVLLELAGTAQTLGDRATAIEFLARSESIAEHLGSHRRPRARPRGSARADRVGRQPDAAVRDDEHRRVEAGVLPKRTGNAERQLPPTVREVWSDTPRTARIPGDLALELVHERDTGVGAGPSGCEPHAELVRACLRNGQPHEVDPERCDRRPSAPVRPEPAIARDPRDVVRGHLNGEPVERGAEGALRDGSERVDELMEPLAGGPSAEARQIRAEQPRVAPVEVVPEALGTVGLSGDAAMRRRIPVPQLQLRDEVVEPGMDAALQGGSRPLEHPGRKRRVLVRCRVRELGQMEELVRDRPVHASEALLRARVEGVRDDGEGTALRARRRKGNSEDAGLEARDVDVRSRIRAARVGPDRPEAAPLEVLDRGVRCVPDALHVVRHRVLVVVVERRRADPDPHVVDDDASGLEHSLGSREVVVELHARRRDARERRCSGNVTRPRAEPRGPGRPRDRERKDDESCHESGDGRPGEHGPEVRRSSEQPDNSRITRARELRPTPQAVRCDERRIRGVVHINDAVPGAVDPAGTRDVPPSEGKGGAAKLHSRRPALSRKRATHGRKASRCGVAPG